MTREQQDVMSFMSQVGQECPLRPLIPSPEICAMRVRIIQEELDELAEALRDAEIVLTYDALLDLMYVVLGTAVACGLDLEPGWHEVHRSNMSKIPDGHKREDGKWIKGPKYSPANLKPIIDMQISHKLPAIPVSNPKSYCLVCEKHGHLAIDCDQI